MRSLPFHSSIGLRMRCAVLRCRCAISLFERTLEDAATDGDIRGKRALLIDISSLNCLLRRTVTKTDGLVISYNAIVLLGLQASLCLRNTSLLLKCALDLTQ